MRLVALLAVAILAGAGGGVLGYVLGTRGEETVTVTSTETRTETSTETTPLGLPDPVAETRAALLAAAQANDYEALRPLIPESGFEYTFGGPVEGGPVAYWQELERTSGTSPLDTLETILELPYVLSRGFYVWPWAYVVEDASELSAHERELLAPLGPLETLVLPGTGYLGWRTGIAPDGTWTYFVAGD